jgi:hypothetical protein
MLNFLNCNVCFGIIFRALNEHKPNYNIMKTARTLTNKQNKQGLSKKPRPEIRDDMDSRKNKEAGYKGDISKKGDRRKAGNKS